jgi:hypothetical protein
MIKAILYFISLHFRVECGGKLFTSFPSTRSPSLLRFQRSREKFTLNEMAKKKGEKKNETREICTKRLENCFAPDKQAAAVAEGRKETILRRSL